MKYDPCHRLRHHDIIYGEVDLWTIDLSSLWLYFEFIFVTEIFEIESSLPHDFFNLYISRKHFHQAKEEDVVANDRIGRDRNVVCEA